ncbi:MAG: DJ-1/PfpI family protein [Pseudomonadota bacterium]
MSTLSVGILVFPKVQQLDLTGPFEVFASVPESDVQLVWKTTDPIRAVTGLALTPDITYADSPQFDVLCIPGGPGVNPLMEDEETLDFIRKQAAGAKYLTSICTGSLVLGAAGLLEGRKATTHWASHDFLARLGAIPVKARVVRDGNLFTGGGVTAGIDMALTAIAEMFSQEAAEAVQLNLEYTPEPPFDAGQPETAPEAVLETVRGRGSASRAEREAIVERIEGARAA